MESDSGDGSDTYVLERQVANGGIGVGFTYVIGKEKVLGLMIPKPTQ